MPNSLITDNETHFRYQVIATVTANLGMMHRLSSIDASCPNGAVERDKSDDLLVERALLLVARSMRFGTLYL